MPSPRHAASATPTSSAAAAPRRRPAGAADSCAGSQPPPPWWWRSASGGAVGRATAPEPPQPPLEAISLEVAQGDDVTVESANLVAHTWGVELRIVAVGFAEGETFTAEFRTDDGALVPAGEFRGVGSAEMTCFLQSASMREDVTQVVVTDDTGHTVLSSDL